VKRKAWDKDDPVRQPPAERLSAQEEPSASDISIDDLIGKGLIALQREIQNLLTASRFKLSPNEAKDLRDHLKLLFELQERERSAIDKLSDDEIAKSAKDILDDNDKKGSTN
jgi:hypothetical protein